MSAKFLAIACCLVVSVMARAQTPSAPAPARATPSMSAALDPRLPTVFIASDSTAARAGGNATNQGWGVPLAAYFDSAKINLANRALGGRSSRTFITEGAWDRLLADVKAGDWVMIQFGHNDAGALNDEPPPPLRARGTIPGLGEETKEIDNVMTKKHEVVHTFGWYMRKMIADTKAKGANPIVLSLTVRNIWTDGKVERGPGQYGKWSAEIAQAAGAPFVDLTKFVAERYEQLGEEKVKTFFPSDHTHTGPEAADLNASFVVAGLRGLKGHPIDAFLSEKGRQVKAAD